MPSNPTEPEKYSLDDMLERLHGKPAPGPEDAGELVTRSDGSQAIKVRKRKRRSVQPHKEAAKKAVRLRAFQVSSVVILIILLGLTFGGLIIYANSAPYRASLLSKFNSASGANTEFHQVRVTPTGTNAARVNFDWPSGNIIRHFAVTEVRAQALLGGIVGGHWGVNEISAKTGVLHVAAAEPGQPVRFHPKTAGSSPVSFERLSVASTDVVVGSDSHPSLEILGTEATFYPQAQQDTPSIRLVGGKVKVPQWPLFRLDRALVEVHGSRLDFVTLRLLHELDTTGTIELSGQISPDSIGKGQKLGVKLSSFNLNGIAGTSLGHLVAGRVDSRGPESENQLAFSSSDPSGKLTVAFASAPNTFPKLNNFRFLGSLWKITENAWFKDPVFHDGCTGILHRENGIARISDLNMLAKTQLSVTGELAVQPNDVLSGTLQIGLPEATIVGAKNPKVAAVFTEARDGFRWVTLTISGTASRPVDNFEEIAGNAPSSDNSPSGDLFDSLTAPKEK